MLLNQDLCISEEQLIDEDVRVRVCLSARSHASVRKVQRRIARSRGIGSTLRSYPIVWSRIIYRGENSVVDHKSPHADRQLARTRLNYRIKVVVERQSVSASDGKVGKRLRHDWDWVGLVACVVQDPVILSVISVTYLWEA